MKYEHFDDRCTITNEGDESNSTQEACACTRSPLGRDYTAARGARDHCKVAQWKVERHFRMKPVRNLNEREKSYLLSNMAYL
jgi:hypothetical protein